MFQNQIYVPPKDQMTCCGVCRNISCLYEHENGSAVLYKVGLRTSQLIIGGTFLSFKHSKGSSCGTEPDPVVFSAGEVLGVKLREVRVHWHGVRTDAHLLLLQLPPLQRDRVHQGRFTLQLVQLGRGGFGSRVRF